MDQDQTPSSSAKPEPIKPDGQSPAKQPAQPEQDEAAVKEWAQLQNLPYYDSRQLTNVSSLSGIMSLEDIQAYGAIPLAADAKNLTLGITDKTEQSKLPELQQKLADRTIGYMVISVSGFSRILNLLEIESFRPDKHDNKLGQFISALQNAKQQDVFRLLVQLAYLMGASDIHIEPTAGDPRMRLRIDGLLHHITDIPLERYKVALSDVQTRAGMRWGGNAPQSGRISEDVILPTGQRVNVNLRLETIPQFHGEEIVVRLFNFDREYMALKNLGLSPTQRKEITELANHPFGMMLTVGPTGSGKTSTLYAIINQINNPEIKVVTLEEPVEYELPGITQIPINTAEKQSFAEELRAVLREDPNIIMVGEIRDADTAKTALQASLTGHLVLSTFHANSASAAVVRLLDMIGQAPLLASSLRLIVAQRLVRRLCPSCKKRHRPKPEEIQHIKQVLGARAPEKIELWRSEGCKDCQGFGYKGRVAILEMLEVAGEMEKLIAGGQASVQDIEALAIKRGMVTMLQDGLMKALAGETSYEEVLRVT